MILPISSTAIFPAIIKINRIYLCCPVVTEKSTNPSVLGPPTHSIGKILGIRKYCLVSRFIAVRYLYFAFGSIC